MKTLTDGLTSPRPACVMKKFAFVLIGIVAALHQVASGQSQTSQIVYENCYGSPEDNGSSVCAIATMTLGVGGGDLVNDGLYPEWSPDGSRIVFVRWASYYEYVSLGIFVVNLADGNVVKLTTEGHIPKWSPDGARIAFASVRDGTEELYVMNADGSYPTRLTKNEGFEAWRGFAWSPDGAEIAFARAVPGSRECTS